MYSACIRTEWDEENMERYGRLHDVITPSRPLISTGIFREKY